VHIYPYRSTLMLHMMMVQHCQPASCQACILTASTQQAYNATRRTSPRCLERRRVVQHRNRRGAGRLRLRGRKAVRAHDRRVLHALDDQRPRREDGRADRGLLAVLPPALPDLLAPRLSLRGLRAESSRLIASTAARAAALRAATSCIVSESAQDRFSGGACAG
jgi:hypothetical protein